MSDVDSAQTYKEYREELKAEQEGKSYDEVLDAMRQTAKSVIELDHLPMQTHRWIDRGAKLTCEGGDHPYHEAWKR